LKPDCPRLFEVEAMRDGRLSGPELAAFGRHLTTCRACAGEAKALDALAEHLRVTPVDEPADELRLARERTRLLADFDRSLLASHRPRLRRRRLWSAAALAVAGGLLFLARPRPLAPIAAGPTAVIQAQDDAAWSRHVEGDAERIVLERGALSIHVDHSRPRRSRLVVVLPDGELEDIGTTFRVTAADGQTRRVEVLEGSVLLRLRGLPPVALSAGQTWTPDEGSPPPREPGPARTRDVDVPRPAKAEPRVVDRAAPPRRREPPVPDESVPARAFRAIVHILEHDDECAAAVGFEKYVATYPNDPRAEDAAYLRVIALQRCGSIEDLKRAAREYLSRYPSGFRRAEVERLSR
jgi:hypothetical protein